MSSSSILITGGAGFIGSHTCLLLLEYGYQVFVVDSLINSSQISLKKVLALLKSKGITAECKLHFRQGDIRNFQFLDNVFKEAKNMNKEIQNVIHFAGLKYISDSFKENLSYWDTNVSGSLNLINIMNKHNCRTIVFSSSAGIYDKNNIGLIKETGEKRPISPYGKTKLAVENILNDQFLYSNKDWKIACLRYFNPIGAHPSGFIGEDPKFKKDNIFPKIIDSAFYKNKLTIYGNDWGTHDGTPIRDYIHVMDIANGHLKALDYIKIKKRVKIALNLGTGNGITVLDLIKNFEKYNNVKVSYEFKNRRQGDVEKLVADNSLAYNILNWTSKMSVKDMCQDGWKWKLNNPKGYL